MSTQNRWVPRINLRSSRLTPLEEKVIRMRYGVSGYTSTPLGMSGRGNAHTLEQLAELEARLRTQADGQNKVRKRPKNDLK